LEYKNSEIYDIKISDFGFSCYFDPKLGLDTNLGSALYMAPEIIKGKNYN
jgi:serine/threonine protein kinase